MPPVAPQPAVIAPLLAGAAALLAAVGAWRVRGSTAVPAAVWATAACLAVAAEMAGRVFSTRIDPAVAAAVRLAVVSLTLCPIMSLLGAKRPQHGVWQFIVATLAVVLALPAATAAGVRPGSLPDVHPLARCLIAALILVGWLNFIGTGRAVPATAIAVAQGLLARGFLPGAPLEAWLVAPSAGAIDLAACGLACAGSVIAACQTPPRREAGPAPAVDRAFLAVRETFGAAWTLRIAERFDEIALARGWPCRLRFDGFVADAGAAPRNAGVVAPPGWRRDARRVLRALLLRFVTDGWLARHGWPVEPATAAAAAPLEVC